MNALAESAWRIRLAGLPDGFLDAGALPTLHDRYGTSREALPGRVRGWLG